jgi:putative sigma-54 modulation protein
MNINIKGTKVDLTPSLKDYVQEKIGNLSKFIQANEARVELDRDQHHHSGMVFHAEVSLIAGGKIMFAEVRAEDMYAAIDLLVPKLKEQIMKFKDKKQTLRRKIARSDKSKY